MATTWKAKINEARDTVTLTVDVYDADFTEYWFAVKGERLYLYLKNRITTFKIETALVNLNDSKININAGTVELIKTENKDHVGIRISFPVLENSTTVDMEQKILNKGLLKKGPNGEYTIQ